TSPPPPTTTFRSRERDGTAEATRREDEHPQAAAGERAATPAQLPLLPGEGGGGRLQEHRPAPPLHLGEGQDPVAPAHRRLPPAPERSVSVEVIRLEDVQKVGLRGEVVDVARGYARNFLVPRKLAERATPARVAELQRRAAQRARQEASTFEQARELAGTLEE